jgi:hypothetical protein
MSKLMLSVEKCESFGVPSGLEGAHVIPDDHHEAARGLSLARSKAIALGG